MTWSVTIEENINQRIRDFGLKPIGKGLCESILKAYRIWGEV